MRCAAARARPAPAGRIGQQSSPAGNIRALSTSTTIRDQARHCLPRSANHLADGESIELMKLIRLDASSLRWPAEFDLVAIEAGEPRLTRTSEASENAYSAFDGYGSVAGGLVHFLGRLRQGAARRSGSGWAARPQRRSRPRRSARSRRPARSAGTARPGRFAQPEHPGRQVRLRIRMYGPVPGQRGSGDGVLRANSKSGAVPGRKRRVLRADGDPVQCPPRRSLRRLTAIAPWPAAARPRAAAFACCKFGPTRRPADGVHIRRDRDLSR